MVHRTALILNASDKHEFWTTLDRAVEEVLKPQQLFVLMDSNARMRRRKKGVNKIIGTCGRDTLNENGDLLLSFASNQDLASAREHVF